MFRSLVCAARGLALSTFAAKAAPVTFVFEMPAFQVDTFTESSSQLTVIADNGDASLLDQTFLNTDIISFEVATNSTTLLINVANAQSIDISGSSTYLRTDALGNGFLNLSENTQSRTSFNLNGDQIQLGTTENGSGFIPYFVRIGQDFGFSADCAALTNLHAISVNGNAPISAVPLPAPLAMLLGALLVLGYRARRA